MAFTLSGTNITQTGTDADLSGIGAIAGVTATSVGSSTNLDTIYDIGNLRLIVQGTLTIEHDTLFCNSGGNQDSRGIYISGTGHLILGKQEVLTRTGGDITVNTGRGKIQYIKHSGTPYKVQSFGMQVVSGGKFSQYGGLIEITNSISFDAGSIISLNDAVWELWSNTITYVSIYMKSTGITIDGLKITGAGVAVPGILANFSIKGYNPINCQYGIGSIDGSNSIFTVSDFQGGSSRTDIQLRSAGQNNNGGIDVKGSNLGNNLSVRGHGTGDLSRGRVKAVVKITPNLQSSDGDPVGDAVVQITDTDNGKRRDFFTGNQVITLVNDSGTNQPVGQDCIVGVWHNNGNVNASDFTLDSRMPLKVEVRSPRHNTKVVVLNDSANYDQNPDIKLDVNNAYSNTATALTIISTAEELYDLSRQKVFTYLTLPDDIITVANMTLVIKAGWSLKSVNGGTGPVLSVSNSTKTITAKLDDTGLQKTAKFDSLSGTIDTSLDGNTNMNYIKSNGKVPVSITLSSEAGTNHPVFGVWLKSQGLVNRTGILTAPAGGQVDVTPNTAMYFVADAVNAYRSEPVEFVVGAFGESLTSSIRRIKKVDGTNLLPDALLVAQQRIADMMNYNQAAARVDITLPSNYATDERWDSTTNTWTFKTEDFWALAYKAEQLQSSEGSLIDPSVVIIDNYELSLSAASTLTFRQDVNNINCTINMNAFIIKRQGDTEQANTFVDHSNGVILVNAGSLIIATVETPASVLSGVTNDLKIVNNNIKDILKLDPTGSGFQDIP